MGVEKVNMVKGKLSSAQILLEQLRVEHASNATLVPTGELATGKEEVQKLLELHRMQLYDAYIKLIDVIKDNL